MNLNKLCTHLRVDVFIWNKLHNYFFDDVKTSFLGQVNLPLITSNVGLSSHRTKAHGMRNT